MRPCALLDAAARLALVLITVAASGLVATVMAQTVSPFDKPFGEVRPLASGITMRTVPVQGGLVIGEAPESVVALELDGTAVPIAPNRTFLLGFHRDAPAAMQLRVHFADGSMADEAVTVARRDWRIEHVSVARTASVPSAAFMAIREPELARIAEARSTSSDSNGWQQRFVWPVKGRISGLFGSQRVYAGEPGSFHGGVDIAGPSGTPIVAPADGVVKLAAIDAPLSLEGHLLMIDHGMGLGSAFLHLSAILVRPGETVRQGQVIGRIGASGRTTGPHLHWGMTWNSARIDPMLVAGPPATQN